MMSVTFVKCCHLKFCQPFISSDLSFCPATNIPSYYLSIYVFIAQITDSGFHERHMGAFSLSDLLFTKINTCNENESIH